jgi:hypothetical protein
LVELVLGSRAADLLKKYTREERDEWVKDLLTKCDPIHARYAGAAFGFIISEACKGRALPVGRLCRGHLASALADPPPSPSSTPSA